MDRRSISILVVCFALLMLWPALVNKIFPPKLVPGSTNAPGAMALSGAATNRPPVTLGTNTAGGETVITRSSTPSLAYVAPQGQEELQVVETPEARYTFTSHGGGLKLVELKGYSESVVSGRARKEPITRLACLNHGAPVPAFILAGGSLLEDGRPFQLERTATGCRAVKVMSNGLHVIKEYVPGSNHLLRVAVRLENRGSQPLQIAPQELTIGTATPISPTDAGTFVRVEWFDGARTIGVDQGWFANRTLGCFPGTPRYEYVSPGASNVVWASVQNQFFAMIAVPDQTALQVVSRLVDLPPPTQQESTEDSRVVKKPVGYQTGLLFGAESLAPGQTAERNLDLFSVPKEYNTLAKQGREIDRVMGFSGFFGWFAKLLLLSMNGLHSYGLSYGMSIIAITVIIKLLFWPLTQVSTRSMKRMQALQPQMKAIQEKYKADPKKMNQKVMEFMKENKVSPLGGCLPMMLQIPVFFGFFQMLRSAIELRGASFLWAADLSQPDTVALIFGFPLNPLPLIMGASQLWQARLTPPSPGVDPMQQKMMQYMPLIFVVFLYNFSAGLALYWTVQNLLSILQMKLTKSSSPVPAGRPAAHAPTPPQKRK